VFWAICSGLDTFDRDGYTPLHLAASLDNPVMALFVAYNMTATDRLNRGWSALAYAAYYGHKTVARALIDAGCVSTAREQVHPYEIAEAKQDEELQLMFFPFWKGGASALGQIPSPPVPLS
jgi:ankyrin repeat protein